jgi:hypothetical protein
MRVALVLTLAACSNAASTSPDAPPPPVDAAIPDAAPIAGALVINEVAAGETPDWFEIKNVGDTPVQLDDYLFCDISNDFVKAKPFASVTLPAGAYFTQDVDDTTAGFKLASDEELWIYRASDHAVSDSIDWADGDSPMGSSYARHPDGAGAFATGTQTKGLPND